MKFLIFVCDFVVRTGKFVFGFLSARPDITDPYPQKCVSTKAFFTVQLAIVALIIVAVMASSSADSPSNSTAGNDTVANSNEENEFGSQAVRLPPLPPKPKPPKIPRDPLGGLTGVLCPPSGNPWLRRNEETGEWEWLWWICLGSARTGPQCGWCDPNLGSGGACNPVIKKAEQCCKILDCGG